MVRGTGGNGSLRGAGGQRRARLSRAAAVVDALLQEIGLKGNTLDGLTLSVQPTDVKRSESTKGDPG